MKSWNDDLEIGVCDRSLDPEKVDCVFGLQMEAMMAVREPAVGSNQNCDNEELEDDDDDLRDNKRIL